MAATIQFMTLQKFITKLLIAHLHLPHSQAWAWE